MRFPHGQLLFWRTNMNDNYLEIDCLKPKILKSSINKRKNVEGCTELMTYFNRGKVYFNKTSTIIFNLLNSKSKTVGDLVNCLYNHYGKSISKDELRQDIMDALKEMWSLGIIRWVDKVPFAEYNMYDESCFIKCTHDYSGYVLRSIKKSDYVSAYLNIEKIAITNIRYELMSGVMIAYSEIRKERPISTLVLSENSYYSEIIALHCEDNDADRLVKLLTYVSGLIKKPFLINLSSNSIVCNSLIKIGFRKITTLKNETKKGDIDLLYYWRE